MKLRIDSAGQARVVSRWLAFLLVLVGSAVWTAGRGYWPARESGGSGVGLARDRRAGSVALDRAVNAMDNVDYRSLMVPGNRLALARSRELAEPASVDAGLPAFKPRDPKLSGQLKSVGSDTMNNLMTLWAEEFRKHYPQVTVAVEGKGSSTAPPALIAGTANLGPMSREMKPSEIDAFEKKFGYKPTALGVSIDMLAVYVNKDNPLQSLSLPQVDAIFSKTRKLGQAKDVRLWGELGIKETAWASRNISLYGRNAASGTYGYFKEHALGNGDFKDTVKEQPGSSSVVQGISRDLYGIGYSGIGYRTADVRPLALAPAADAEPVSAEPANAYSGEYPLARMLLLYLNVAPGKSLDPLRSEFLRFIFSKEGQQVVLRDGYLPVTAAMALEALESVGLAGS